jgi:hypothetical protein
LIAERPQLQRENSLVAAAVVEHVEQAAKNWPRPEPPFNTSAPPSPYTVTPAVRV